MTLVRPQGEVVGGVQRIEFDRLGHLCHGFVHLALHLQLHGTLIVFVGSGVADIPILEDAAIRILDEGVHLGPMNLEINSQHPANPVRTGRHEVVLPFVIRLARGQSSQQRLRERSVGTYGH